MVNQWEVLEEEVQEDIEILIQQNLQVVVEVQKLNYHLMLEQLIQLQLVLVVLVLQVEHLYQQIMGIILQYQEQD